MAPVTAELAELLEFTSMKTPLSGSHRTHHRV
jgi:hypothetical protein